MIEQYNLIQDAREKEAEHYRITIPPTRFTYQLYKQGRANTTAITRREAALLVNLYGVLYVRHDSDNNQLLSEICLDKESEDVIIVSAPRS